MFKKSLSRFAVSLFFICVSISAVAQNAKLVIGGTATATDTVKAAIVRSTTSGFKFPDATIQTSAAGLTISTGTSIINNLGGGNTSAAALSFIGSGKNNVIPFPIIKLVHNIMV